MAALLSLPHDVLINVFILLSAEDLLVLNQTCRSLHEYTMNDYIWHQLPSAQQLPLVIPPYVNRNLLTGPVLKTLVTHALRVDNNWRRPYPEIRSIARLEEMDNVMKMQFIGSGWLVVLRRSPPAVAVLRMAGTKQASREASIGLSGYGMPLTFAASMQEHCTHVTIAVILAAARSTRLVVYSVALEADPELGIYRPHDLICDISRPEADGPFYEVHIFGHTVAVGIPQIKQDLHRASGYRILTIDTLTGARFSLDPLLTDVSVHPHAAGPAYAVCQDLAQVHFKLYPGQLVLTAVRDHTMLVARRHRLVVPLPAPEVEEQIPILPRANYHLSADSTHGSGHLTTLFFRTFGQRADLVRLSLHDKRTHPWVHPFPTHTATSAEMVCLGETGTRAVWLEKQWGTDEFTLMKAIIPLDNTQRVVVEPLLAKHKALPFELRRVQCLALEEATGRVCLTTHFGELFMLQF
ncbi:unnamed protein product [Mycena citricolor]|uniref:F-box domain-containing protein n=1 Tax=Mycena citricolor TaxID=2018698 RepID=A0AAD2H3I8_9AGAR|nr:unnamed protein product [Mycena citricolor]